MLKVRINKNQITDDKDEINTLYYQILDIDSENSEKENTKSSIRVNTDNLNKIKENTEIICYHNVYYSMVDGINDEIYVTRHNVEAINSLTNSFAFSFNKFIKLSIERIYKNDDVVNFIFKTPHYFDANYTYEYGDIILYFKNDNEFIPLKSIKDNEGNVKHKVEVEYVANNILSVKGLSAYEDIYNKIFNNEIKNEDGIVEGITDYISIYREHYYFTHVDTPIFYYDNPKCNITIPLTKSYDVNLLKESWMTSYVNSVREKSINPVIDMEKDIYYPVFTRESDDSDYEYVNKIIFNLHFRKRTEKNWIVKPEDLWNGVDYNEESNEYTLNKDFFNSTIDDRINSQSDLLTYLDFSDNDVRYQKNKLKKSFLRLLFYDSDNPANQNLLMYSTIFMNSGDYFNKYIKNIEESPYKMLSETDDNIIITENLKGIRVDREPYGVLIENKNSSEIEEKRLSSQFVIEDKYSSKGSSEGFYIYLWKDILDNLVTEEEKKNGLTLYMRVEFNHAGYGRIIPFMMPYWDNKKWGKKGIKSLNEIINDWNEEDEEEDKDTDGKYGAKQYMKFSYIKLTINYDETHGNYIYCLSGDYYGENPTKKDSDNNLIINLYEANMV